MCRCDCNLLLRPGILKVLAEDGAAALLTISTRENTGLGAAQMELLARDYLRRAEERVFWSPIPILLIPQTRRHPAV